VKAVALAVELGLADGSTHARSLRPVAPSGEARTWRTLVLLDLETHPPRDAIVRITARAEPTAARSVQFSLLDPAQPSPERLANDNAAANMNNEKTLRLAAARKHAPPGAFAVSTFTPALPRGRREEAPRGARVGLRVFRPPLPAHVVLEDGAPAFVSAPGVRGRVEACAGPWRASGDWWDVAFSREEWDVALAPGPGQATGGLFRLFLDRLRGEWFLEGELD
jgi:protein ImuB